MLKRSILRNYREDVEFLTKRLTFDGVLEKIMAIAEKLKLTREASIINEAKKGQYSSKEELLDDLYIIRKLIIDEHESLFLNELNDFIYKVKLFGFHFASIDLRQDSRVHSTILSEFLENYPNSNLSKKENYLKLDFEKRKDFLTEFLQANPSPKSLHPNKLSELSRDCFDYISSIDNIQNTNGLDGLHRYIISNTRHEINIMELYVLLRLTIRKAEDIKVDLVPLFETISDLENSIAIMDALYSHPVYKKHLHLRNNKQYIMLGFSDGTKDGGYITANWSIYQAKEKLSEVSEKHGINVVFFDGRGGPPARGGGNTRNYYLGQGEKIHQSEIQLTIQGQTISSKFGRNENCRFNLENLLTAGLENKLFPDLENEIEGKNRLLINELSNKSFEIYSKFKNHPLFLSYLEERTPLKYFSKLNIASRPVKRKGNQSLRFEDLRAIPFVASWAQAKHNIPGYYGVGSSINQLIKAGKLKDLQKFYQESRFFRTLLGNSMQSLEKTNMSLTAYMKKDRKYGKFWEIMRKEVELSIESLKQVSHQNELLANLPVTKVSVKMRERIVFPLLVIQQWAFLKLAKKGKKNKAGKQEIVLEKLIIKALAGNVNASRNSA